MQSITIKKTIFILLSFILFLSFNIGSSFAATVEHPGIQKQNVSLVGHIGGGFSDVFVSGNYLYAATRSGLQILDISTTSSPTLLGEIILPSSAFGVSVSGDYAYVADKESGLQIINVSNPASPTLAGSYDTPGYAYRVSVSGNYAYVADGDSGLFLLERTDTTPTTIVLTPKEATNSLWSTHTLEALVKDQNGNPIKDVTVTFTVTGENSQTGTAVTNSLGIATFSYIGENSGTDTIVASADPAISNSVTKEWILVNTPGRIVGWGGYNNTSFFNFNILSNGKYPIGTFYYSDRIKGLNLWSNQITGLMVSPDKKKAVFTGKVKIGGATGYKFVVYVNDNGNPGTNDKFKINIYDPSNTLFYSSNGTLFTGNIKIYP